MLPTMCLVVALLGADASAPTPADKAFQTVADEFLSGYFAFRPHLALELGLHEYDGKLSDYSQAALAREHERLQQFEKRLTEGSVAGLSPSVQADHEVLLAGLRKALFEFEGSYAFH